MDDYLKLLSFLSLAKKSGNLKSGEFQAIEAVKTQRAGVVIIAEDASDNTKKLFTDKSNYREIPVIVFSTKEDLGRAIGKDLTASLAIVDDGMAKAFLDKHGRYLNGKNESI